MVPVDLSIESEKVCMACILGNREFFDFRYYPYI